MSNVLNLRNIRKRKAREIAELEAAARRAKFGTAAAAKQEAAKRLNLAARKLDAHRLDPPSSGRVDDAQ